MNSAPQKTATLLPIIFEDLADLAFLMSQILSDMQASGIDPEFIKDFKVVHDTFDHLGRKWILQVQPMDETDH